MPAILPFISVTARVASSAEEKATNAEPRLLGKGERSGSARQQSGCPNVEKNGRDKRRLTQKHHHLPTSRQHSASGRRRRLKSPPREPDARIARVLFYLSPFVPAPEASRMTRHAGDGAELGEELAELGVVDGVLEVLDVEVGAGIFSSLSRRSASNFALSSASRSAFFWCAADDPRLVLNLVVAVELLAPRRQPRIPRSRQSRSPGLASPSFMMTTEVSLPTAPNTP